MASTEGQIPTPFVPSDEDQHVAITGLHTLIEASKTGEHPAYMTTTHSGLTKYIRNLIPRASLDDFEDSWHLGNYVMDRKTGHKSFENMPIYVRLGMHFIYYGPAHERVLKGDTARWILEYHTRYLGNEYSSLASKAHIEPFIKFFKLQDTLHELEEPDPNKYANFNLFFARGIKPSARPISAPDDDLVISSPADCRLMIFPTIDQATKYWIKGYGFTIAKLLQDEGLAKHYDGGSITIARLAPQDYHRWHAPVDGHVYSINTIPGAYYTVNPQAINQVGTLDVFCENRRSVMIIARPPPLAPFILVAVGAMLVGSIQYRPEVMPGAVIKRGQCLGCFFYGGSTVIMLMAKGEMIPDEDLVWNSTQDKCETLVKVGEKIGRSPGLQRPCSNVDPVEKSTPDISKKLVEVVKLLTMKIGESSKP